MLKKFFFTLFILLCSFLISKQAFAGVIELGVSGSYRHSNIDRDAFDEASSFTGSVSYYFDEMSALESSYTSGASRRVIGAGSGNDQITTMTYNMLGLDFILTLGEKGAVLRPYLKMGAAYIMSKKIYYEYRPFGESTKEDPAALVPSAGVGFKFSLTQTLSLKTGIDAWTSRSLYDTPVTIDYAGKAGLSWMF